jgi:hypothetical protein
VVLALACVALAYAIAWGVLETPEAHRSTAHGLLALGNDIAIAYIAAWLFNLLVVVLPRIRAQERIRLIIQAHIKRLTAPALKLRSEILGSRVGEPSHDNVTVPDFQEVALWAREITVDTPEGSTWADGSLNPPPLTWGDWFERILVDRTLSARTALGDYFALMELPAIQQIEAIAGCPAVGLFASPFVRKHNQIGWMSSEIQKYIDLCFALRRATFD